MKVTRRTGSLVIVLVIFAAIVLGTALAAIAIDKSEIPMLQQHAAEAAGEEYVHGSNIGRTPSGTNVNSASAFRTAVNNNQDINLTDSFTISSPNIRSMADYSATIYGNGYTITFDLPKISGTNNSTEDYSGSNYYYCGLLVGTLCGRIYDLNVELTGGSFKTGLHTSGGSKLNTFGLVGRLYTNGNNHGTIENVSVTLNSGVGIRLYSWANTVRTGLGLVAGLAEGGAIIRNVTVENNGTLESGYTTDASSASDIVYNDNGNVELRSASNVVGYFDSWSHTSGIITLDNIIVKGNGKLNGREACNLGTSESGNTINVGTFYNHFVGTFNGAGDTSPGFIPFDGNSTARTIKTLIEYNRVDNTDCVAGYGRGYNASINEKLTLRNTDGEILFDPAAALDESLVLIYRNSVQNNAGSIYIYNLIATNRTSKGGAATTQTYRGEAVDNDVIFTGMPVVGTWNNCDWGRTTTYPGGDGVFTSQFEAKKLDVNVSELTEYDHGYVPNGYTPSGTGLSSTEFFNTFVNIGSDNTAHNGSGDYYLEEDAIITGFTGRNFGGTLDGNGRTIYITGAQSGYTGGNIGGIVGVLNAGTIKNLRIVLVISVDVTTSATGYTSPYRTIGIGGVAGAITGNALIENVSVVIQSGVELHGTSTSTEKNLDFSVGGIAGSMSGRGRISNTTVQLDGTLYTQSPYPFVAGFVGNSEDPNFTSDGAFNYNNIIFKGSGHLSGNDTDTSDAQELYTAAVTITDAVGSNNGTWVKIDGFIYAFNDQPVADGVGYSMYGFVTQNHNGDSSLTSASDPKPIKNGDTTYISASNIFTATRYTAVKKGNDKGNTYWDIPTNAAISGSVTNLDGSTVTPYFRPGSDDNITLVASGTGVSGFNGVLKEKGATIGEGKDSIPAAAKDGDNLVLEMPKADVVSASDTSVGLEEAKTVTLTTDINKSFTYSGSSQARDVYLKYGESSISDYTVTYAAESGSELSNGSPVNAGSYYISVVALTENAGDYYFFDTASNTLSKSYTYASADENSNKFVIKPAQVNLAFVSGSMTVTYDAKAVENPEVSVSGGTFGLDDLGELTYVWMNADGPETLSANPTDAGSYKVKISAVANPNFTVGGAAASGNDFTIKAKEVTLSVEEGGTSFAFAQDTGALTDENYEDIGSYSFSVTGFVEGDDDNSGYTVSITTTEGDPDPSFITENTTGTSYLSAGVYTATVVLSSQNYTFGEGKKTFTVTVNKNSSANKWLTEYAREGWTYYSDPSKETAPVARFGSPAITYSNGNEGFSNTTAQGTYTVNVSVAETDNYGALTKEYSFTVSALDVTVALSAADTVYDGQPYEASNISITLTATVNGTETTYTSADNPTDVSTLLGSYGWQYSADSAEGVTETKEEGLPTNAGKYTLYIHNYNNGNVNVTGTLYCTATIDQAEVTFSAAIKGGAKLVYGTVPTDFNSLVNVTARGGINLSDEGWSYTVTPSVENGEYGATTAAGTTVTLTVQVSVTDPNHTAVQPSETLTLEIQKADIGEISVTNFGTVTIGFTSYDGFVYGQAKTLEFNNIPADLTVTPVYTYAVQGGEAIDNFVILTADSGIYTVTVSITGDTNYNDKTSEAIEFAIAKADRSVTVSVDGWTYGEEAKPLQIVGIKESETTVRYSGTTNAGVEYDLATAPEEAGSYTVTVSWDETTNYTAGSAKSEAFTIKRANGFANISVNGTPYTKTVTAYYTGKAQPFKVTVEGHDGGEIKINDTPSSTMDYNLTNAGTTTINVTVAQTPNYFEATATAYIEILRAVIQSVTLKTTAFAFGTLNTENANDAATYGTPGVAFVDGKGSGAPEFTYSLAYSKTENGSDKKAYIVFGEEYTLTLALTGETAANFVFDGNTSTTAVTVQVTKGKNTWISEDKIVDYPFGLEGKPVTGKAKFGTAAVTYYREGKAIEFNFKPMKQDAGTYTAVVSVSANDNYDGISYEYTFAVKKHGLNITITKLTIKGTEIPGSAADGYTVTYAPDMGLSAEVSVGSAEKDYNGSVPELLGSPTTRTYLFEYSADAAEPKVWTDGLPENAGTYTVRFKGMKLAAEYNINNFKYNQPEVGLTISQSEIKVKATLSDDVRYGMTAEKIRSLITLTNEEGVTLKPEVGVTLGEVKVTYNNGTDYNNTVAAGTELTISIVSVKAENKNYIAKFVGSELTPIVQKATLHVSYAESSSVLSADFDPGSFDRYAAITATWGETTVKSDDYFDVALTGYEGEVTGMTLEEIFANKEIGTYTFTVTLQADDAVNFVTDPETIVYELTLAKNTVKLTVAIDSWTYGDSPATPEFTAIVTDEEGNETDILQIVGQSITVKYSNDSGDDLPGQPTDAGTYTLTANIVGHHDYVAENAATAKFTITARSVSFVTDIAGVSAKYNRNTGISSDGFIETFGGYFVLAEDNSYAYDHALADVFNTYPFR